MSRGGARALKHATAKAAAGLAAARACDLAPLYRAQFDDRGPWWWSRRPGPGEGGRVDLAPPDGTVCFATSAAGAVIEKVWDPDVADPDDPEPQLVLRETLERIIVWQADADAVGLDQTVTDLTDGTDGLPKEFTTAPYAITQAWADAVREHSTGRDGIVYWLRLDPSEGRAVCLFAEGPDDDAPGFVLEPFDLRDTGPAVGLATTLPTQMFTVVARPADADVTAATLDTV